MENQHSLQEFHISERMAENVKEEMIIEEIEIKGEIFIKKEICVSFSLDETCTWDNEEDVNMENTEITEPEI